MPQRSWTVIYDGECRLCCRSMSRLRRWDRHRRILALDLHSAQRAEQFPGLDVARLRGALHAVDGEGRIFTGVAAIARLGSVLPGWRWAAWLLRVPGISGMAGFVYRQVARNRHRWNCRDAGAHCGVGTLKTPPPR